MFEHVHGHSVMAANDFDRRPVEREVTIIEGQLRSENFTVSGILSCILPIADLQLFMDEGYQDGQPFFV